jgi:hypothetical protein
MSGDEASDVNQRWNNLVRHIYNYTDEKNWNIGAKTDITVGFSDSTYGSHYMISALNPDYRNPKQPTEDEKSKTFRVRPFSLEGMNLSIGIMAGLVVFTFVFGAFTNLLRDPTLPDRPSLWSGGKPVAKPYSLAFCQIAFWTIIIVACYLFIYLSTNNYNCFNSTALALLGISATTGLGAVVINNSTQQARQQQWSAQMVSFYTKWRWISFFTDLFCERENMSFHRIQLVVWTVVIALVFVNSVFSNLEMPTYDPTILILIGIANGTYLGMKAA